MNSKPWAILAILVWIRPMLSAQSAEWQQSAIDDPAHKTTTDKFVLAGAYLTPPHTQTEEPSLEVLCSKGKFRQAYIHFGGTITAEEGITGPNGNPQAKMEGRAGARKISQHLEIAKGGTTLAADKTEFSELLKGRLSLPQADDPDSLARRLVLSVNVGEYSPGIVIQFELPADQEALLSACDLQGKKKK